MIDLPALRAQIRSLVTDAATAAGIQDVEVEVRVEDPRPSGRRQIVVTVSAVDPVALPGWSDN